ncbi:MAG: phosphohistidine phosphatase SixA [Enterobacteriaceae bacterium]
MKILIMRHGEAAPMGVSDAQRPLTSTGREEAKQIANWLQQKTGSSIDKILVSPYLRARQTLAAVKNQLALPAEVEELPELRPGGDARVIADYLQALAQANVDTVLIISHLPLVGYLVSELCPTEAPPMFPTAAIAQVVLDKELRGELDWQVSPSQLRSYSTQSPCV